MMLGKIICWWKGGHLRGKPVGRNQLDKTADSWETVYECPRCRSRWNRKAYARKAATK